MFTNWLTTPATTASSSSSPPPHHLTTTTQTISHHPPPDIIIELGPPPFTQYAAHSTLLMAHSGYIRALLHREDGRSSCGLDAPVFIPNVTAEQFSPLLTYMYTGFLDLTIENIFSVLLATHVLHMPRALEICRSFLTRTQTGSFFGGFLTNPAPLSLASNNQTIIRPIPSKARLTEIGLSHITAPSTQAPHTLQPSQHTNFQKISSTQQSIEIPSTSKKCNQPERKKIKKSHKKIESSSSPENSSSSNHSISIISTSTSSQEKSNTVKKQFEVAQPALPSSKIIIDVASCDGPVRFRRVLNEAYGRSDEQSKSKNHLSTARQTPTTSATHHNQRQSINSSFHQQMARNISERQNIIVDDDESENSEDTHNNSKDGSSNETYICVYCKHTFKSQYCYQKHAKRHLNPMDGSGSGDATSGIIEVDTSRLDDDENSDKQEIIKEEQRGHNQSQNSTNNVLPPTTSTSKREVRPLDMNVQYYPCKTCGCKFPSYYFVHKHRKMCHADEEN